MWRCYQIFQFNSFYERRATNKTREETGTLYCHWVDWATWHETLNDILTRDNPVQSLLQLSQTLPLFQLKRTNFAEFTEVISEIPTITTWIEYWNGPFLKYRSDFYITLYDWEKNTSTDLKIGKNRISGSKLRLYVEEVLDSVYLSQNLYITALNFSPGMPFKFTLKYTFGTQFGVNISSVSTIAVALSTQNNSKRIFSPRSFLRIGEIVQQNLQNNFYETFSTKNIFESFFSYKMKRVEKQNFVLNLAQNLY